MIVGQGLRFLVVGGTNTLITYVLYCLLVFLVPTQLAWTLVYLVGIVMGYVGHSRLVFSSGLRPRRAVGYALLQILMYVLSSVLIAIGMQKLFLGPRVAAAFAIAVTVPISFLLARRILRTDPPATAVGLVVLVP